MGAGVGVKKTQFIFLATQLLRNLDSTDKAVREQMERQERRKHLHFPVFLLFLIVKLHCALSLQWWHFIQISRIFHHFPKQPNYFFSDVQEPAVSSSSQIFVILSVSFWVPINPNPSLCLPA